MFRNLFNPDSPLMITMAQITDCIFLSLFWLLGTIPLVTVGASCAALYDASLHSFRQMDKHAWQRFAHVFRTNWKAGILPSLVFLAVFFLVGKGMILLWNGAVAGSVSWLVFSGAAFLAVLVMGILGLLFPLLSRFENTFPQLMKNTVFLAMAHLPRTVVLGILNTVTVLLCLRFVVPLFFLPALNCLLASLLIEPIFQPYMEQP